MQAYYSPQTLKLVREMVTGGSTGVTERMFAEGLGLMEGTNSEASKASRCRARISEIYLNDEKYQTFFVRSPSDILILVIDDLRNSKELN